MIATAVRTAPDTITLNYTPGGGVGATARQILWNLSGESGFPHGVDAEEPEQVLVSSDFESGAVAFRTRVLNDVGETLGDEVTVEL